MKKFLPFILLFFLTSFLVINHSSNTFASFDFSEEKMVPEEIIVKFNSFVPQIISEKLIELYQGKIKKQIGKEKTFVLKVPKGKEKEIIKAFSKNPLVAYAEPNYLIYALMVPNDPYYSYQWHLDNSVYGGIQMEKAWEVSKGEGVTVAVVDSGIRRGTDLLNTCFVAGYDFVNNDSDPTDENGHGTHVAGTIAQSTNNSLGVAGIAYKSCLMPVRVLDASGSGTYADVADGIRWAVDNKAKIINLSLGGTSDSQTLKEAVAYAYQKGVVVIAACGNDNKPNCLYPASYDDYVIAVGATQYDETKAPYSNYGPSVDLVAPGGNTSIDQNKDGYGDGVLQQTFVKKGAKIEWGYYFYQGTSMATPHVSGVAALVISAGRANSPLEVKNILQQTAEDKGTPGRDDIYGWGLVDAAAALGAFPTPSFTPTAIPTPEFTPTPTASDTPTPLPTTSPTSTPTPTPEVTPTLTPIPPPSPSPILCWREEYQYLYLNQNQLNKFCKCAEGRYGSLSYNSVSRKEEVYYYSDPADNEDWTVRRKKSLTPVYEVRCLDGKSYLTNRSYYWPK
ncbi:MAG: S8 family serine peptidase [Microgenomates group bacterium]